VPFDPYQILGIDRRADVDEIRQAYRRLARELHPDLNKSTSDEERFKELGLAYAVLNDPERRRLFDRFGDASLSPHFEPPSPGGAYRVEPEEEHRITERDILVPLEIKLTTAIAGGQLRVSTPAGGALTVVVPPGVESGHLIRCPGRGRPGRAGSAPGDLVYQIRVKPHPYLRREGRDLVLELPVTVGEAHFGARIRIPTLEGWLTLRVPPASRGGERLRLRGKGSADGKGDRGDLYVHLCIRLPDRISSAERSIERLAALYSRPVRDGLEL
jgi:curved DNA-binding protein